MCIRRTCTHIDTTDFETGRSPETGRQDMRFGFWMRVREFKVVRILCSLCVFFSPLQCCSVSPGGGQMDLLVTGCELGRLLLIWLEAQIDSFTLRDLLCASVVQRHGKSSALNVCERNTTSCSSIEPVAVVSL